MQMVYFPKAKGKRFPLIYIGWLKKLRSCSEFSDAAFWDAFAFAFVIDPDVGGSREGYSQLNTNTEEMTAARISQISDLLAYNN